MIAPVSLHATAKVNLYLHVTGKRPDGYHLLDSLTAFPADIYDTLHFAPAELFSLSIGGEFSAPLLNDSGDNLITKAADRFFRVSGIPMNVSISLQKNIPLGAGLGGGSADAAATIAGLEKFFHHPLPQDQRQEILMTLGADVPVCYAAYPCRFQGIGEEISGPVALPPLHIGLVWPNVSSLTKDVFARYTQDYKTQDLVLPAFTDTDGFLSFLKQTDNSLQSAAESLHPVIGEVRASLEKQPSCLLARMTGSGSTVFGLFSSAQDCRASMDSLKKLHPDWWTASSPL